MRTNVHNPVVLHIVLYGLRHRIQLIKNAGSTLEKNQFKFTMFCGIYPKTCPAFSRMEFLRSSYGTHFRLLLNSIQLGSFELTTL